VPVTDDGGVIPTRRTYRLEFADDYPAEQLRGLVVRLQSAPLGVVLQWGMDRGGRAAGGAEVLQIFHDFAACIIEWNLRAPDGSEVPPTHAGLLTQDEDFVLLLIREWQAALTGVAPPLGSASSGGATSAPAPPMHIPMELQSDRVS
jgi:hypothetical protein